MRFQDQFAHKRAREYAIGTGRGDKMCVHGRMYRRSVSPHPAQINEFRIICNVTDYRHYIPVPKLLTEQSIINTQTHLRYLGKVP